MYKIFFFLIITTILQANQVYDFEVSNPTMAHAYFDVFNSISAIFSSVTYYNVLQLVFLVGGFLFFSMYVLNIKSQKDGEKTVTSFFKYMVAGTALMIMILGNGGDRNQLKVTSNIIQNSYCSDLQAVNGNAVDIYSYNGYTVSLPGILPEIFGVINKIGVSSTELAASAFSGVSNDTNIDKSLSNTSFGGYSSELNAPNSLLTFDYRKLGSYATGDLNTTSYGQQKASYIYETFPRFMSQCVHLATAAYKKKAVTLEETLAKTSDIYATLDDLYSKNEINRYAPKSSVTNITTVSNDFVNLPFKLNDTYNYSSCKTAWQELYKPLINKIESEELVCDPSLKDITPGSVYTMTKDTSSTSLGSVNRMVTQSALINTTQLSKDKIVLALEYAKNKTLSENAVKFASGGMYMSQMLPYLQMGIRAVLYAFFPFAFLFMLLPGGFSVIKNYLKSLLWVELWSPVAAILNLFLTYFSIDTMGDTYADTGLSAVHGMNLVTDATMLAGVAGYLYTMVPALTWLILKGSGEMIGNIGHEMASALSKNLDSKNVREDFADIKKLNEYNKNAGTANFVNRVEQLKLDTIDAGIEGGSKGMSIAAVGGRDQYLGLSQKDKTQKIVNDLAYAKKSSLEAQEAMGEGLAIAENTKLAVTGQLKNGEVNHEQVEAVNRALGIDNGADLLRAEKTIDFMQTQSNGNAAEVLSESKTAIFKGDFTQQVTEARQFALANGLKVNGKNPNDATVEELIEFSSTVKQEIGAQDGKNHAVDFGMKQAILESRGMLNGAGVQNELNANTAYKEKVDRFETNQKRAAGIKESEIAKQEMSATTQNIAKQKEQADILGTDINNAAKELSEMQTRSEVWNEGVSQNFRESNGITIEHEANGQVFLAAKSDTINNNIKNFFKMLGMDISSYESGEAFALLSMLSMLPDVDTKAKAKEKLKKLKSQSEAAKKHKKLQEKLDKETDLKKREKIQKEISKVEKKVVKIEAKLQCENFDPKTDPQKIIDNLLSKEQEAKSILSKLKGFTSEAKGLVKGAAKGGVVGVVVDTAINTAYDHTDDGSKTKAALSVAKNASNIAWQGLSSAFGDWAPLAYAYVTGDKKGVEKQLEDIEDTRRQIYISALMTAADTYNATVEDGVYSRVSETNGDKIVYKQLPNGKKQVLGYYLMDDDGNSVESRVKVNPKYLKIRGFKDTEDYFYR